MSFILLQGGSAEIQLVKGKSIKLSTDEKYFDIGDENCIYVDYKNITKVLQKGSIIYVDDGLICLSVEEIGKICVTFSWPWHVCIMMWLLYWPFLELDTNLVQNGLFCLLWCSGDWCLCIYCVWCCFSMVFFFISWRGYWIL